MGKGVLAAWRKRIDHEVAAVVLEMERLSNEVRADPNRPFSLNVYWRKDTGQRSLRWRDLTGGHVLWSRVMRALEPYPPRVRSWYIEVNQRAEILNAQMLVRRRELQLMSRIATAGTLTPRQLRGAL